MIDEGQAAIIRRNFDAYARGKSARSIAIELNREGVAPPRLGKGTRVPSWSFSTISGNWKRGTGILNNELYLGKPVWNPNPRQPRYRRIRRPRRAPDKASLRNRPRQDFGVDLRVREFDHFQRIVRGGREERCIVIGIGKLAVY